ncbi:MAG: peptidoglycan DD-metalloendopeptidase family protein [Parvibaculum sp.]
MPVHHLPALSLFVTGLLIVFSVPVVVVPPAAKLIQQNASSADELVEEPPSPINFSDCLRGRQPAHWPHAYQHICADLVPASVAKLSIQQEKSRPRASQKSYTNDNRVESAPLCFSDKRTAIMRGKNLSGIAITLPAPCSLHVPVSGTVVYADRFQGYGGVVIIDAKEGRKLVIAGLSEIHVRRGEKIYSATSIGKTGQEFAPALRASFKTIADENQVSLVYFDMRDRRGNVLPISWISGI